MSSATKADVARARNMLNNMPGPVPDGAGSGPTHILSPRQLELDHYYRYYRCSTYDGYKLDWDGNENMPREQHDGIVRGQEIPPGFYDAGQRSPLKYRKPCASFALARVVVTRLTSMLFSKKRHPRIDCDDPDTADWLLGFAEATQLWMHMERARNLGGAMGTVVLGYKFIEGKPIFEVHDGRWCTADWEDRTYQTVTWFEKRYQFVEYEKNPENGQYEEKWYWYRRVIDDQDDTVWAKVSSEYHDEPDWPKEPHETVTHGYGFCPIVWVQNHYVDDDMDGDPDCHGCYDLCESVDVLNSQARRGTVSNCDPTMILKSNAEFDSLRRGSNNSVQVELGGDVSLLEMQGGGVEKARQLRDDYISQVCTVARVMLDRNEGGPAKTEEEIEHAYSAMTDNCDTLRERYGECGIKPLLQMVLKSARMLTGTKVDRSNPAVPRMFKGQINMPKRKKVDEDTGESEWLERKLGTGEQIDLIWPPYFTASQDMVGKAVDAAAKAKQGGLIDQRTATKHVVDYFPVEDVNGMLERMAAERSEQMGMGDAAQNVAERTLGQPGAPKPGQPGRALPGMPPRPAPRLAG
jgi:hypothetical protein